MTPFQKETMQRMLDQWNRRAEIEDLIHRAELALRRTHCDQDHIEKPVSKPIL